MAKLTFQEWTALHDARPKPSARTISHQGVDVTVSSAPGNQWKVEVRQGIITTTFFLPRVLANLLFADEE